METSTEILCGQVDPCELIERNAWERRQTVRQPQSTHTVRGKGLISNIWAADVKQLQSTALAFSRDQSGIAESLLSAQQADPALSNNQITCSAGGSIRHGTRARLSIWKNKNNLIFPCLRARVNNGISDHQTSKRNHLLLKASILH